MLPRQQYEWEREIVATPNALQCNCTFKGLSRRRSESLCIVFRSRSDYDLLFLPATMATEQTTIIPHSQQPYVTRTYPTSDQVDAVIVASAAAQEKWKLLPLKDRIAICSRFLEEMKKNGDVIAKELTTQMGR